MGKKKKKRGKKEKDRENQCQWVEGPPIKTKRHPDRGSEATFVRAVTTAPPHPFFYFHSPHILRNTFFLISSSPSLFLLCCGILSTVLKKNCYVSLAQTTCLFFFSPPLSFLVPSFPVALPLAYHRRDVTWRLTKV
eukprot:TRINITY_DN4967_c0_g1_i4.p1 TRINITY_DN4967_c0_g1~~TRINITY_DN4967_c0_g1_i4.p1  ORF type:complete len:136 (+),score=4.65 TRINITY_DN4967_c0_g1_i4:253-660(+)